MQAQACLSSSAILDNVILPSEKVATVKFALIQTEKLSYGCYESVKWSGKMCLIRPFVRKDSFNTSFFSTKLREKAVQLIS